MYSKLELDVNWVMESQWENPNQQCQIKNCVNFQRDIKNSVTK